MFRLVGCPLSRPAIARVANHEWSPGQLGWTLMFLGQPAAGLIHDEEHLRRSNLAVCVPRSERLENIVGAR
jgi:hypothetical protein